jgi:hypothetical protein
MRAIYALNVGTPSMPREEINEGCPPERYVQNCAYFSNALTAPRFLVIFGGIQLSIIGEHRWSEI